MPVYTSYTYYDCIAAAAKKAASFGNGPDVRTLLFCEDKLTLSLELAVAKETGGTFAAEVSSFGRFARKHGGQKSVVGKEGSAMIVRKIFSSLAGKLKVFDPSAQSPALASTTAELIAQLKSAKVSPEDLAGCLGDCPANVAAKLSDIALVYGEYENYLRDNSLLDSNNALSLLPGILRAMPGLARTHVLVVGYSSVTKQSCDVLSALHDLSGSCDFFAVSGENDEVYTNEFLRFVRTLDETPPVRTECGLSPEGVALRDGLFQPGVFAKDGQYSDKVVIYQAKGLTDECEFVGRRIRYEVIRHGLRYRDVAVAAGDISSYAPVLTNVLSDLGVPCFVDRKRKLSEHPLLRLFDDLLRLCVNKDVRIVRRVLQNSVFLPSKDTADDLLARLTAGSVTGKTFFDPSKPLAGEPDLAVAAVRDNLLSAVGKLSQAETVSDFCDRLRSLVADGLADNVEGISLRLEEFGETAERSFNDQAIGKLTDVLDEAQAILGDERTSADAFRRLLSAGAEACETSVLPETADGVYCSELKNVRFRRYKLLFVIGLSSDVPAVKGDTALLLDSDISALDRLNVSVEPKIRVVNRREQEAASLALLSFSDKLFLSYSLLTPSGGQAAKSRILDYAVALFSDADRKLRPVDKLSLEKSAHDLTGRKKDAVDSLRFLSLRPALFSLLSDGDDYVNGGKEDVESASSFYRALERTGNETALRLADRLIGNAGAEPPLRRDLPVENYFRNGLVNASVLETYFSCPYKCYARYCLGLRDDLSSEIRALDFGNVLHAVAENFVRVLPDLKDESSAQTAARRIFDEIIQQDDYRRFLQHPDYAYSAALIRKESEKICLDLFRELTEGGFRPEGEEVWFADGCPYPALPLRTKTGTFRLRGKADRLDRCGDYVRIVDYKTGSVAEKVKDEKFYTGNNLQLYLYLNAFAVKGKKPAGAYYYAMNDNFAKEGEPTPLMSGKTLSEEEVLRATDPRLAEDKRSRYVDVRIRSLKSGEKATGSLADERTLRGYMKYAMKIAELGTDEIASGTLVPSPYKGACDYCEYGGLCRYDCETGRRPREVRSVTPETVVSAAERTNGDFFYSPPPQEKNGGEKRKDAKEDGNENVR
ncbi:MAG: PD-(D/E)XK nuclease family protein [Candidatus Borkfalkiaceae bacterium]|nr:PD-(D/E)XK nuclease family protein [Christensenellaceae bacterium]